MKGLSIHHDCLWLDHEPLLTIIVPERGSVDRQHKINKAKTLLIKIVNDRAELERLTAENALLRDANEGAMHDGMAKTEETRQVMLELEKVKAENAELKAEVEKQSRQGNEVMVRLVAAKAELAARPTPSSALTKALEQLEAQRLHIECFMCISNDLGLDIEDAAGTTSASPEVVEKAVKDLLLEHDSLKRLAQALINKALPSKTDWPWPEEMYALMKALRASHGGEGEIDGDGFPMCKCGHPIPCRNDAGHPSHDI